MSEDDGRQIRAHFPLRTWEVCCQLLGTRIHLPVECGTRMFVFLVRKRNASILFAVPAGQVSVTFGDTVPGKPRPPEPKICPDVLRDGGHCC